MALLLATITDDATDTFIGCYIANHSNGYSFLAALDAVLNQQLGNKRTSILVREQPQIAIPAHAIGRLLSAQESVEIFGPIERMEIETGDRHTVVHGSNEEQHQAQSHGNSEWPQRLQ